MVKVPFAVVNGVVGFPQTAARDCEWRCPVTTCNCQVIVKRGTILAPHFAHKGATSCNGESLTHRATKEWICATMSTPDFEIKARCDTCAVDFVAFRGGPSHAGQCEVPCGAYKIDVAAAGTSTTAGVAIEVFHTHKTDTNKMKNLMAATLCNAFEVKAVFDLVAANYPTTFRSVRPLRCRLCLLTAIETRRERARRNRLTTTRKIGRRWHDKATTNKLVRASKFGQRWMFLARVNTVSAKAKRLRDADEADRVHTCAGCKHPLETYVWVRDADARWGYSKQGIGCATVKHLEYHPKCSPLCPTCKEVVKLGRWCACERWKRRPCGNCTEWGLKTNMHCFDVPTSNWDTNQEWVCNKCGVECRQCTKKVSPEQAKYGGKCFSCNSNNKRRRFSDE